MLRRPELQSLLTIRMEAGHLRRASIFGRHEVSRQRQFGVFRKTYASGGLYVPFCCLDSMNYRGSILTVSLTWSISFGSHDSLKPVVWVSAFHGSLTPHHTIPSHPPFQSPCMMTTSGTKAHSKRKWDMDTWSQTVAKGGGPHSSCCSQLA